MKFFVAASFVLFASINSFAVGAPVSTGSEAIKHAMLVFPEGAMSGSVVGIGKCVVEARHGQGGNSITVSVKTYTGNGVKTAACSLLSENPAVREDSSGSEFPQSENLFGTSNYGDGQGSPTGCRFGRTKDSVVVVDFDHNHTAYCQF